MDRQPRFAGDEKRHGRGMPMVFWKEMGALLFSQNRRGALRERRSKRKHKEGQSTTKLKTSGCGKNRSKRYWSTLKEEQQKQQRVDRNMC